MHRDAARCALVQAVWQQGKYVPGVAGVTGAMADTDSITIHHGSGVYSFVGSA